MRERVILAALFAGLALLAAFLVLRPQSTETFDPLYWKRQIDARGAGEAHERFAAYISDRPQGEQHVAAHQFGKLIYESIGLDGIDVCDGRFSYGCLHQVLGMALGESGAEAITQLEDRCNKAVGASGVTGVSETCRHALGHGLMFYFDYTPLGLRKAVDACTPYQDATHRKCEFGAFMEFNVHFMQGGPLDVREPDEGGKWYPCTEYEGESKNSCYYAQPRWWRFGAQKNGIHDEHVLARDAGANCSELSGVLRKWCFRGIGSAVAWNAPGDVAGKGEWCDAASADRVDRIACKSDLAFSLLTILKKNSDEGRGLVESICSGQSEDALICETTVRELVLDASQADLP